MVKLKYLGDVIKLLLAYCISMILKLSPDNKDIWLVGERKSEAKDNGYHLFKYIRQNHSSDKVYYVIDKNSTDLEKLLLLGNVIYADSFRHYLYYAMANKLVMAHLGSCVPDSPVFWKLEGKNLIKKKRVFIQHGITKELIPSLMYENTKVDLFICGAKPEYEFVKSEFGYPDGSVQYAGFARFDNLHDFKEKKQILVMPTWRQWIPSTTWSLDDKKNCRELFVRSQYYKTFNRLINNNELIEILNENDINLIFYPHYEMQLYINLFNSKSERIIIAKKDEYDVQQLLKESKILITDYSSIAFDFAYMRKSVIYYQFDKKQYDEEHYSKGYYNYTSNGFGPIVYKEKELIKELIYLLNDNLIKIKYIDRYNTFFPLYDKENCKRNFEAIKNII